jgi:hypothetical protein
VRLAFQRVLTAFGVKDLEQLSKKGRSFGVLSAYRSNLSKSQNQERHGQLVADLQRAGIRQMSDLKSQWEDMDTKVVHKEKSIFVPHISFDTLVTLGKKYEQDAVLYKDPSGTVGIYFKDGTATMAFDPRGDAAMTQSPGKEDYSKGRSVSFGLQLVEDKKFTYGGRPVTRDDVLAQLG